MSLKQVISSLHAEAINPAREPETPALPLLVSPMVVSLSQPMLHCKIFCVFPNLGVY
jgi:hypothetical protein